MKHLAIALCALTIPIVSACPKDASGEVFGFKTDKLGEAFADFKQNHSASGIRCRGEANTLKTYRLPEPSLSDEAKLPRLDDSESAQVLVCGAKDFQTVAEVPARFVEYYFLEEKLYRIQIQTVANPLNTVNAYSSIKSAYAERYGAPKLTAPDVYHFQHLAQELNFSLSQFLGRLGM